MEKILKVHSVNDYTRYIGAEEHHTRSVADRFHPSALSLLLRSAYLAHG